MTKEHRQKISLAMRGNKNSAGIEPWNKGKKASVSTLRKMSLARRNAKNPMWKGDAVGYDALHDWVRRRMKKLSCQECGTRKDLHCANKSGEYQRDMKDWMLLCAKCHKKFDWQRIKRSRNKLGQLV